jgi:hypothetical protein
LHTAVTRRGEELRASATFPEWDNNVTATPYAHSDVPGGSVEPDLRTQKQGRPVVIFGRVVEV